MTTRKKELEEALQEAIAEQEELEGRLDHKPEVGLGRGSSGLQSWELTFARQAEVTARIDALKAALNRVGEGTYGQCERCGTQINPERLKILPATALCVDCAGASPASESNDAAPTLVK
jgi:RNA polymerase-binding transcription factor DksA